MPDPFAELKKYLRPDAAEAEHLQVRADATSDAARRIAQSIGKPVAEATVGPRMAQPRVERGRAQKRPANVGEQYGGGLDYWLNFVSDNKTQGEDFEGPQAAAEAERIWTIENADAKYNAEQSHMAEKSEAKKADVYRQDTAEMRDASETGAYVAEDKKDRK